MAVTLVALYDNLGDAAQVRRELEAAGVPSRDISISDNAGQAIAGTQIGSTAKLVLVRSNGKTGSNEQVTLDVAVERLPIQPAR